MFKKIGNERGFALILVIMIMAAMTAIGMAAIMTSTTDIFIARNEKESKTAFYLAETGMEEAISRMDLMGSNARFVGENAQERKVRVYGAAGTSYAGDNFTSADLGLSDLGGTYSVAIRYALEDAGTWCDADGCGNGEIVLYNRNFGFGGYGVSTSGAQAIPVYRIESTGTTTSGTPATIRAYATPSILNVVPPNDTIMFVEGGISIGGNGSVNGRIASLEELVGGSHGCQAADWCQDVSAETIAKLATMSPVWQEGDMDDYLGMSVNTLRSYADAPAPYSQSGAAAATYNPGSGAGSEWGQVCSPLEDDAEQDHICDKESKLIYIDNAGAGPAKVQSNTTGRGILLVTGDLELAGGMVWEGLIYVMGTLKINGDLTVWGAIMVDGNDAAGDMDDVQVNGGLKIQGSIPVASSVGDSVGIPRVLRWTRWQ